uniref:ABC transporter domain-containing protein n=1 Tax=Strigamia maritima TaxID=126957 RepID=T1J9E7_STRMM
MLVMPHAWEMATMERRYSVPPSLISEPLGRPSPTEDLHAWSIYRQNLNSDFSDNALGSSEKSPLPYGNFQLRETTVQSIFSHPRYGPRPPKIEGAQLGANMVAYLKFGLPRVFPPTRLLPDGSSGYDSSEDGYTADREGHFRRSRSDPDFRNHILGNQEVVDASNSWWRERKLRSSSEANLLANGDLSSTRTRSRRRERTRSMSRISQTSRSHVGAFGDARVLNDKFFPRDVASYMSQETEPVLRHPHLQVRNLTCEEAFELPTKIGRDRKRWIRVLEDVSLDVHGGELLGILTTHEYEGTTLLDVLAYQHCDRRTRVRQGELYVNGTRMSPRSLKERIAYVQQDCHFIQDMSVRQTLLFASLLQEPGNESRQFDTKGRINALIEDLGLGLVKHTRVKNITVSEKCRLNVACRLLLDTEIVLLDQPTKGMDVFDTFFLIEYLRQWAARGRVVIVTIQPPTYEILTMLSKVALLSTGRFMYFGKRREMLPYFAFIDYPCPAYKNPADYYLDLVTLDNLSPEAMLESSQRIDILAETFRRRQEALPDPGPPGLPLQPIKRSNVWVQMLALWIRALIYMFPYNLISLASHILLATFISVVIGAIFYNVRLGRQQEHALDRISFYYILLGVAIWPIILVTISNVWALKDAVNKDIKDALYSRLVYFITMTLYSFLPTCGVYLAFSLPAYCMAGLQSEVDSRSFSIYIGFMLLYLFTFRAVSIAMAFTFRSRHWAACMSGAILAAALLTSGWPVHLLDLSVLTFWLQWVSPARWTIEQMIQWDFYRPKSNSSSITMECSHNPTIVQERGIGSSRQPRILVQAYCGLANEQQVVTFTGLSTQWPSYIPLVAILGFLLFWYIWAGIACVYGRLSQKKSRSRLLRDYE